MALISRLGVILGLDSAEFNAGLGKAEAGVKKFQGVATAAKAGIAALGATLVATAYQSIQFADSIDEMATAYDVTTSSVLEFSKALVLSGGKTEMTGRLMGAFTSKVDEAAEGSEKVREKFAELGITLSDLGNKDLTQLMKKSLQGLAQIEDPIRRVALATDVFGKGIKNVDLKSFNNLLQELSGTMEGSDEAFSKIAGSLDRIEVLSGKIKVSMANNLSVPFEIATTAAEKFYDFLIEQHDRYKNYTKKTGFGLSDVLVPGLATAKQDIKMLMMLRQSMDKFKPAPESTYTPMAEGDYTPSILKGGKPSALRLIKEGEEAKKLREALEKNQTKLVEDLNNQLAVIKLQNAELDGQKSTYEKIKLEFAKTAQYDTGKSKAIKEQILEQAKSYDLAVKAKENNKAAYDLDVERTKYLAEQFEKNRVFQQSVDDIKIAAERLDYERQLGELSTTQTNKALAYFDLSKKIMRMREQEVNMSESEKENLREQIDLMAEAEQMRITADEALQRSQRTFQHGWDKAYADFVERSKDSAGIGAEAFNSMTGNMESALDRFVQTGKLSFKDLASSIIQDLIRVQLKAQATSLFSGLFGNIFGGGGSGGGIGLFSSSTNFNNGAGLLGGFFADGGDPPVNMPSIVGERGPEVFVPKTAGTIVPNHTLSSALGGSSTVNNYYIDAIDTKSFEDRLIGSHNAVWAANQYAGKSLQTSRSRT